MNNDYINILKKYLGTAILIIGYVILILGGYWKLVDGNGLSVEELNLYTWIYIALGNVINITIFAFVKDWIVKKGKKIYKSGEESDFVGFRYVKDVDINSKTQNVIDRFGMETEIDETIDIVNMENKLQAYSDKVSRMKSKIEKKIKRKIWLTNMFKRYTKKNLDDDLKYLEYKSIKNTLTEHTKELDDIKKELRDSGLSEKVSEFDDKFIKLYSVKYKRYSYESIKFKTSKANNIIDKIRNSKIVYGFGGTVVSLTLAVMFFRYFNGKILEFQDSIPPEYITILAMIAIASFTLAVSNIYRAMSGFKALYYNDVADVSYIYRKFNMRYRKEIDKNKISSLPDDAQKIIDDHFKSLDI